MGGVDPHTENFGLAFLSQLAGTTSRRRFIQCAGVTLAVTLAGCSKKSPTSPKAGTHLSNNDTGVLNYAYALEQLEAAFYTRVISTPYSGITTAEAQLLTDIRDHEIVHRNFLKQALGSAAIQDLEVTFTSVDFTNRNSVLTTARTFEDLGVSAYNGAGRILASADLLLIAGKIVSVEARHAAAIRDLLSPASAAFAGDDVVDPGTGLDVERNPSAVLTLADPFIVTTLTSSLP